MHCPNFFFATLNMTACMGECILAHPQFKRPGDRFDSDVTSNTTFC